MIPYEFILMASLRAAMLDAVRRGGKVLANSKRKASTSRAKMKVIFGEETFESLDIHLCRK